MARTWTVWLKIKAHGWRLAVCWG